MVADRSQVLPRLVVTRERLLQRQTRNTLRQQGDGIFQDIVPAAAFPAPGVCRNRDDEVELGYLCSFCTTPQLLFTLPRLG